MVRPLSWQLPRAERFGVASTARFLVWPHSVAMESNDLAHLEEHVEVVPKPVAVGGGGG